ncbi:hypothetical protein ACEPAH_3948 [Sanghuangporus vaninii]
MTSAPPSASTHKTPVNEFPYLGEYICIRAQSAHQYQAFVSNYSGGDDSWFSINDSFADDGRWTRKGWEVVAIRNKEDTDRCGYYVNAKNHTVYITVKSLKDVEVKSVKRPE